MAESTFIPELGHIAFGQGWQEYEAPEYLENALMTLGDWFYEHEWTDVDGYRYVKGTSRFASGVNTPFDNGGAHFKNDVFEVEAYSWDDDYEQPYNFKWRDLEVSWYKWLGRDTTCNRIPGVEETEEMLRQCLESLGE